MSFKSFFKHLGHAIEHAAKDVVHGVENVGKDLVHMGEAALHAVDDLAHLKFKAALNDAVSCANYGVKAITEMPKAEMEAACDATTEMHFSKSLDKMAQKVKNIGDKVVDAERQVADKVLTGVADGIESTVKGSIAMAKDVAHGDFGKALHDGMGAVGGALTVAAALTPEGLAAAAVVGTMQVGHIGGEKLQSFVGDVVGGPKGLLKRAAESGAGLAVNEAVTKTGEALGNVPGANSTTLMVAGMAAPLAADAYESRRGRGRGAEAPHTTTRDVVTPDQQHPNSQAPGTSLAQQPEEGDGKPNAQRKDDARDDKGHNGDRAQNASDVVSNLASMGDAASTIAAARASSLATMAAQDAIAAIQNAIALNQAKNQIEDELGKGVKALAQ
ncbi:hypothetical protein FHW83_003473 [Duganella sp. SG902]|uniref:hypothetical protein n=1 Tax=Duganella sp. SG902 TaxID=2587016 RepID=UPI00159E9B00|nr:hypothetical protein [Duganella sp. SG902]NVM77655.1 hypothetical protein [Duganella sp. SG902]